MAQSEWHRQGEPLCPNQIEGPCQIVENSCHDNRDLGNLFSLIQPSAPATTHGAH